MHCTANLEHLSAPIYTGAMPLVDMERLLSDVIKYGLSRHVSSLITCVELTDASLSREIDTVIAQVSIAKRAVYIRDGFMEAFGKTIIGQSNGKHTTLPSSALVDHEDAQQMSQMLRLLKGVQDITIMRETDGVLVKDYAILAGNQQPFYSVEAVYAFIMAQEAFHDLWYYCLLTFTGSDSLLRAHWRKSNELSAGGIINELNNRWNEFSHANIVGSDSTDPTKGPAQWVEGLVDAAYTEVTYDLMRLVMRGVIDQSGNSLMVCINSEDDANKAMRQLQILQPLIVQLKQALTEFNSAYRNLEVRVKNNYEAVWVTGNEIENYYRKTKTEPEAPRVPFNHPAAG